jgi:hypothetical protein
LWRKAAPNAIPSPCHTHLLTHADEPSPQHPAFQASLSIFVKNEKHRPTRCFLWIGKALSSVSDDPHIQDLLHEFFGYTDSTRYFKRKYLKNIRDGDKIHYNICDLPLDYKICLQNYTLLVCGTIFDVIYIDAL